MLVAPARELPQVQLVGLAGQPAVPGQEPGSLSSISVYADCPGITAAAS